MDNIVYNEHIIEYLFKSLKENDIKELIKSGKYINNIIKALFYFSQINGYLLIQKLLFLMKNYAPSFDLKALILPPVQEPYENMVNIEEIFSPPLEDYDEENKKDFNIMRFLLYCALNYRMINNYETIAVLFEYCPLEEGIDFLIKELMWNNIDNLFIGRIKYIEYFTNPKNKNKIKELGKNFFNFINLVESILNQKDYISKLSDKEKYILINYIKIFLLEIVPKELEIFLENDKENNTQNEERDFNSRNHLLYQDESKLFIILSLYELKGNPIISIKGVYPIFYSKIESFLNKCKSIDINPLCIKKESDTDKLNKIKNILTIDYNFYIIYRYNFQIFPNFMNLIQIRKNPNSINQSSDIKIPSLSGLAETNLAEETERKKIGAFLEKIIKKNKQLEEENSILKEKIQEQNEVINVQKQKLSNCDFIVKTCIKKTIMESLAFYKRIGNQNGVNIIEEILKLNENNVNNNYSDESEGENNAILRFGRINTP